MRRVVAVTIFLLAAAVLAQPVVAVCSWVYPNPPAPPSCSPSCNSGEMCSSDCRTCVPTGWYITDKWGCGCDTGCDPTDVELSGAVVMTSNVAHAVSPYTGWEPGTIYTIELSQSPTFGIKNSSDWGSATEDTGLDFDSITVDATVAAGPNSDTRLLYFSSLDLHVHSFAHSKIAPDETGLNEVKVSNDEDFPSIAIVDINTGAASGKLLLRLYNDYYDESTKAGIQIDFTGRFNSSTGTGIDTAHAEFGEVD